MRSLSSLFFLIALSIPTTTAAAPVIDVPASLGFGNVVVGGSSNLNLTIGNTGNAVLSVTSIAISGGTEFTAFPPPTPFNVPPGGSVSFTVTFAPTSNGLKNATITIISNDPITPSKPVALNGTGVSPIISVSPTSLGFGNVNVLASTNLVLTISNTGNLNLSVSGITFSGTDAAMFGYPGTPPSFPQNVAPGGAIMISIRFAPTSAGPKSATATVTSNDPLTPNKAVSMTGTGIGPIISTTPVSDLPFGDVHVASSSNLNVIVTNAGGGTLTLSSFSIVGVDASSFSLVSPPTPPVNLANGATLFLTVRFAPSTIGLKGAALAIASNDVSTPVKNLPLSGTSIRPEPVIAGVKDVPNDQGGRVKLSWDASTYDTQASPTVDHYWIFRSVPPQAITAASEGVREIAAGRLERARFYTSRFKATTYYWELLETVQAIHFIQGYSHITATLSDSTGTYNPYTLFMVMALDAGNTTHYDSAPDSGYSVDNLAPAAPASLTGSYRNGATHLHWLPNAETDLSGYRVYRGASASFVPNATNLVGSPPDTGFADAGDAGGYYKLSAVDSHGNQSVFALLTPAGTLDVPGSGPMVLALARPAPNPARGEAEFGFTLPQAGPATLAIYDGQGRRVGTLVHGARAAGRQTVRWNGRDDEGRGVPDGVYFARLEAAGRTISVRFAMVR